MRVANPRCSTPSFSTRSASPASTTAGTLCEAVGQMVLRISAIPPILIEASGSFCSPGAEVADESVEGRREQQTEGGDTEHPEEHSGSDGLPHLRACSGRHGERENAEDEGEGRHQNGAEPGPGSSYRGFFGLIAVMVLPLARKFDDEDRVFRRQPHQYHEADLGEDVDRHAPEGQTSRRG